MISKLTRSGIKRTVEQLGFYGVVRNRFISMYASKKKPRVLVASGYNPNVMESNIPPTGNFTYADDGLEVTFTDTLTNPELYKLDPNVLKRLSGNGVSCLAGGVSNRLFIDDLGAPSVLSLSNLDVQTMSKLMDVSTVNIGVKDFVG